MRVIALLFLLCTLSGGAIAQASQCQSIPKASDRLSCYDKTTPPTAVEKPAAAKAAAVSNTRSEGPLADVMSAENKKLDAAMKNICRGC